MKGSEVRERLRRGERVYGTHIAGMMNPVATRMATEMQLDFAFFCTEHMPIDRTEVSLLCQIYAARGISPIVRVPTTDPAAISAAIDGGAEGIVVPYVETLDEVRAIVGAVKYRPIKGSLLRNAMEDAGNGGLPEKTRTFLADFNRDLYVIIGVESVPAIENLEQLLTAADVDGVFLGPHDITTSMGIPTEYDNPEFLAVIEDVIRRCRKCGVGVGLHTPLLKMNPIALRRLLDAGMNWILNASDIVILRDAMNGQMRQLRAMCADVPADPEHGDGPRTIQSCIN